MDITIVETDGIYQEEGLEGVTKHFDCDIICTTAIDPVTGDNSQVLVIHNKDCNACISLDAEPILLAVSLQLAKNNLKE